MTKETRYELVERWIELKTTYSMEGWVNLMRKSIHFSSVDSEGRIVEGFYSPDEKLSSAMIYRNHINE